MTKLSAYTDNMNDSITQNCKKKTSNENSNDMPKEYVYWRIAVCNQTRECPH